MGCTVRWTSEVQTKDPGMLEKRIRAIAPPGTVTPKPVNRMLFRVVGDSMRREQPALIHSIPNLRNPGRPYRKGITWLELERAYAQLRKTGALTTEWFRRSLAACYREEPCNFTTVGGLLELLGEAVYAGRGVYVRSVTADVINGGKRMPFQNAWNTLQRNLTVGTVIPNWTADNGLLGDSFSVAAVTPGHIDVDAPGAQNVQRVPLADFQLVYDLWHDYLRGAVPRREIRDSTRFSKYIISILHWLEDQAGGNLP